MFDINTLCLAILVLFFLNVLLVKLLLDEKDRTKKIVFNQDLKLNVCEKCGNCSLEAGNAEVEYDLRH